MKEWKNIIVVCIRRQTSYKVKYIRIHMVKEIYIYKTKKNK